MKKKIHLVAILSTLLLLSYSALALVCVETGNNCITCYDEAAHHPQGGCVSGAGCPVVTVICGYPEQ